MKKKHLKLITTLILLCITIFGAVFTEPLYTFAASDNSVSIMHKISTATANSPINYNFELSKSSDINFILRMDRRTGVTITVKDQLNGIPVATDYISPNDSNWEYNSATGIYMNTDLMHLDANNYILELMFDMDVNFEMNMNQVSPNAKLNKSKLTITNGFSSTLTVDGGTIKSCSSSNSSVASVNNKGKVTGKKTGTATITVKLKNGEKLKCKVTVKPNKYTAKEIGVSDTLYNTYDMKAYNASFDSKGNLVIKFKIVNNNYGKITSIPDFKITVIDSKKKTVTVYKKSSYKVSVNSYSDKKYSITIPKSSLKMSPKKIDLRNCSFKMTGNSANATL